MLRCWVRISPEAVPAADHERLLSRPLSAWKEAKKLLAALAKGLMMSRVNMLTSLFTIFYFVNFVYPLNHSLAHPDIR